MLHRALISLQVAVSAAQRFGMSLLYDGRLLGERARSSNERHKARAPSLSGALTLLCVAVRLRDTSSRGDVG
jgi:hypothetical protein